MEREEYFKRIKEIDEIAKKEKEKIHIQFAFENRKANIGDVVRSDYGTLIKVSKLRYYMEFDICKIRYEGAMLKKNFQPMKNNKIDVVSEDRVVDIYKTK